MTGPDPDAWQLALAWWDWPLDRITRHLTAIRGADLFDLERAAAA